MKAASRAYLEITNCCNLSCSFCHKTSRLPRTMSEEEFELLTDRLQGKVRGLYFHLMGEPLLHPLLPKFVCRAKEKGFLPMVTTNGTLLSKRGAALLEAGPYRLNISLHAPEANGAFASEEYLEGCIRMAERAAGAGTIAVLRLWNIGGLEAGNGAILSALHSAFPGDWKVVRSGFRLSDKVFLEWGETFDWPDLSCPEYTGELFCYGLRDHIGVLADGSVVPCCLDADGIITLGNLFDSPLEEILESPRARAIYNGFSAHRAVEPLCRHCGYAAVTKQYRKK